MTIRIKTWQKILLLFTALIAALSLVGCGGSAAAQGEQTITISGAFALYPMVIRWSEEYKALHPDVQFDIQAGGAGKGMSDVLAGAVDIAMVSREVRPEEADQGAIPIGVAKDAVLATINANNPVLDDLLVTGITPEKGAAIWLDGSVTTWGELVGSSNEDEIHVFSRADSCGAAEVWALYLGGEAQEDLTGIAVQGDPGLAEAVRQDELGIGFNNLNFAYDASTQEPVEGIAVIPMDINGDGQISEDEDFYATKSELTAAIAAGIYPSPPSRTLYLVTKGAASGAAKEFMQWILTDGQEYLEEVGYVNLTDEVLQEGIDTLNQ
jgi:phosphate transport system substrate-binding protein